MLEPGLINGEVASHLSQWSPPPGGLVCFV
jgi:hypothetical protein